MLEIIILAVLVFIVVILIIFFKKMIILAINSIIGIFALFGFNLFLYDKIPINFWSVIITAVGGIIGFLIVVILHFMHILF